MFIHIHTYIDTFIFNINMLPKGIFIYVFDPSLKALISWFLLCLSLPSPKQFSFKDLALHSLMCCALLHNSHL